MELDAESSNNENFNNLKSKLEIVKVCVNEKNRLISKREKRSYH